MDGTIVTANENFLKAMGYTLAEIQGKHHSMFVEPADARQRGLSRVLGARSTAANTSRPNTSGSARAARKSGSSPPTTRCSTRRASRSRWSSSPPTSPAQKLSTADLAGQIAAIGKSQAVIEFNMDGTIIGANQNFLKTVGYALGEIQGKHHSMFVDPSERDGAAYREFWASAQPRRISGRRIQADRQGRQGSLDPGVLQSDPRSQRQAVQGRQIRHRHHRAGAGAHGQ